MTIPRTISPADLNRQLEIVEQAAARHDSLPIKMEYGDPSDRSALALAENSIRVVRVLEDVTKAVGALLRANGFVAPGDDRLRVLETAVFHYIRQGNPKLLLPKETVEE